MFDHATRAKVLASVKTLFSFVDPRLESVGTFALSQSLGARTSCFVAPGKLPYSAVQVGRTAVLSGGEKKKQFLPVSRCDT